MNNPNREEQIEKLNIVVEDIKKKEGRLNKNKLESMTLLFSYILP